MPLPAGMLPESLKSLHLTDGYDTGCAITEGVLPSNLRRLELHEWKLPLSDIALPASLVELDIHSLHNHPLPVLPAQLEVLRIGGAFNQSLLGVLPASLRVLRLTGNYYQPFTADVCDCMPQLEELYLSDHSITQPLGGRVLPQSLRILRVGQYYSLVIPQTSDVPPQLRRLIVPAGWTAERVSLLQQLGVLRGFTVERG